MKTQVWRWTGLLIAVTLAMLCSVSMAYGQADTVSTGPRKLAFEVVSIRPSKPGSTWSISWTTSPDGYRSLHQSIRSTIMLAYFPQGMAYWSNERLVGAPAWIDDLYDMEARVAPADGAEWQKQGMALDQKVMLQEMLKTMLAERCGLAVHWIPGETAGYELLVEKRGPRLTQAKEDAELPQGVRLAGGGVLVPYRRGEPARQSFFGVSMNSFARQLSMISAGRPVEDRTGLTGKYDFVLSWLDLDPDADPHREGSVSFDDPNPLSHWDLNKLGLRAERIKVPTKTVRIDHIDRPSEN